MTITGRDGAALEEAASAIAARGPRPRTLVDDAGDTEAHVRRIRALDVESGGLDLVIANAGVGVPAGQAPAYAWEAVRDAFHVNFCGAAATLTATLPSMVKRGRGHVVGIGSLASFGALPGSAAYCAPKAGLAMLLDCLKIDLEGTGVAVTQVNLGFVSTRMVAHATHPMPQLMSADRAAERIARRLASRPGVITLPRTLAALARGLGAMPTGVKAALAARLAPGSDGGS